MSGTASRGIGLSPGTAFTGSGSVTTSGSTHLADAEALQAKADLVTAYQDITARPITVTVGTEREPH